MSEHKLRQDLDRLRAEVKRVEKTDPESKQRIDSLIADLEKHLDQGGDDEDDSILDSVRDAIKQFQTQHPRATAILNDIMVTLSNMGI